MYFRSRRLIHHPHRCQPKALVRLEALTACMSPTMPSEITSEIGIHRRGNPWLIWPPGAEGW